jgi:uncharacterized protein YbjQ (UPF0145 family)
MNKLFKVTIFLLSGFLLQSCVVGLRQQAITIRIIDDKKEYNCKFINTVTGSGSWGNSTAHDAEGAMNEMRNKVEEFGGNALKIINVDSSIITTTAVGEALSCDFEE